MVHQDPCLSPGGTALAVWKAFRFWLLGVFVAGMKGDQEICKAFPVLPNFLSFLQLQSRNEVDDKWLEEPSKLSSSVTHFVSSITVACIGLWAWLCESLLSVGLLGSVASCDSLQTQLHLRSHPLEFP